MSRIGLLLPLPLMRAITFNAEKAAAEKRYPGISRDALRALRSNVAFFHTLFSPAHTVSVGSHSGIHAVSLAEAVTGVGDGERAVGLRRHPDPVCGAIVRRRRSRTRSRRRKRYRGHRHCGLLLVDHVGDEQARHGVLLPAEKREMNLPEVLEAGRSVKGL